jgi:hypothetical protein
MPRLRLCCSHYELRLAAGTQLLFSSTEGHLGWVALFLSVVLSVWDRGEHEPYCKSSRIGALICDALFRSRAQCGRLPFRQVINFEQTPATKEHMLA